MAFQVNATGKLTYYHYIDDVLTNATSITLDVYNPDWSTKLVDGKTPTKSATGTYYYDLVTGERPTTKGTYKVVWKPVYSDNNLQDEEWFDVGNLADNALCFTKDVQDLLKLSYNESVEIIQLLINQASKTIENFCHRSFFTDTYIEVFDGEGQNRLYLANYPIISVSSLTDDDDTVTSDDYLIYENEGIIELDDDAWLSQLTTGQFSYGKQHISITYSAGYGNSIFELPYDLRIAAIQLVSYWYKVEHAEYSETFGESQVVNVPHIGIPNKVQALLEPYRKMRVGAA